MSSFTTPLIADKIGKQLWVLLEPFEYHVGHVGSGYVIHVPAGFETDFASVPWFAQWLLPPDGKYAKAAVIHDFLYVTELCSRWKADWIFLEGMKVLEVPSWKRWLMWSYVRLLGWIPWLRRGKLEVRKNREKYLKD